MLRLSSTWRVMPWGRKGCSTFGALGFLVCSMWSVTGDQGTGAAKVGRALGPELYRGGTGQPWQGQGSRDITRAALRYTAVEGARPVGVRMGVSGSRRVLCGPEPHSALCLTLFP